MGKGRLKRVGRSRRRLFGPRRLLVCGFDPGSRRRLLEMMADRNLTDIPVVFPGDDGAEETVAALLEQQGGVSIDTASSLQPAIIMAGITEKTLHKIINGYRSLNLPPPLWATVTPTSVQWTLAQLLAELEREQAEMASRR
jgi:hypothetical protein